MSTQPTVIELQLLLRLFETSNSLHALPRFDGKLTFLSRAERIYHLGAVAAAAKLISGVGKVIRRKSETPDHNLYAFLCFFARTFLSGEEEQYKRWENQKKTIFSSDEKVFLAGWM